MKRFAAMIVLSVVAASFAVALLLAPTVAVSHPGYTCNPPSGHGVSGCHKVTAVVPSVPTSPTATTLSCPSGVKVRKPLRFSGSVSPTEAVTTVTIVKTRKVGRRWKSAGSAKVAVVNGSFVYSFKPTKKGSWRFYARFPGSVVGSSTYAASKSRVRTVKVR
jgi:hypothetical protein